MHFSVFEYRESLQKLTLDDLLNQLEIDLSKVGHTTPDAALKMLLKMDQASITIGEMNGKNNPIKAEAAQFNYVTKSLGKNSASFLKDMGGKEKLRAARQNLLPDPKRRWWFLDLTYEQQVQARLRYLGQVFGGLVVILAVLVVVYKNFLAPDPLVVKRYSLEMDADQAIGQSNYAKALDDVNQALEINSQDPSLLILRGVLYDRLDQKAESSVEFSKAETVLNNREQFLLSRADAWMKVGDLANGFQDTQDSIRENPNSAEGYFYFGKINVLMQNNNQAIDSYTRASQLADQQGKTELNATIRMAMAMAMQSIPAFQPTKSVTSTK